LSPVVGRRALERPEAREMMLQIAKDYERLVEHALTRKDG